MGTYEAFKEKRVAQVGKSEKNESNFMVSLAAYLRAAFSGISKEDAMQVRQKFSYGFDRPIEERLARIAADLIIDFLPTENELDEITKHTDY